jgi:hypothetical protein
MAQLEGLSAGDSQKNWRDPHGSIALKSCGLAPKGQGGSSARKSRS